MYRLLRPYMPAPPIWLHPTETAVTWAIVISLAALVIHLWHTAACLHRWSRHTSHLPILRNVASRWLTMAISLTAVLIVIAMTILDERSSDSIGALVALAAGVVSAFAGIAVGFALAQWSNTLSNDEGLTISPSLQ